MPPRRFTSIAASVVLLGVFSAAACGARTAPPTPHEASRATVGESIPERRARLVRELQGDILSSYARTDSLAFADGLVNKTLIDLDVGSARIGVGPDDVVIQPVISPSTWHRWPLSLDASISAKTVSKRLRVRLAATEPIAAAWVSDELSWQIEVCGRTAVIPLRITALFAHDGDQWYEVFEHVSYGNATSPQPGLRGARMRDATPDHALVEFPSGELGSPLAALLSDDRERIADVVVLDPAQRALTNPALPAATFLLGPRFDSEWHGERAIPRLDLGIEDVHPEDRRAGPIGTDGTLAYWIGNFIGEHKTQSGSTGPIRLRGTFVFEKRCSTPQPRCRPDKWFVLQAHISEPIGDAELARRVFGSVVASVSPLRFACPAVPP